MRGNRLSTQEQAALCAIAQRRAPGDPAAAEERLLLQFDGLCKRLAGKLAFVIDYDDGLQEARCAALRAFRTFNSARGVQLCTYVHSAIVNALRRLMQRTATTITFPAYVYNELRVIDAAEAQLQEKSGRSPSDEELADVIGLPADRVRARRLVLRHRLSLDAAATNSDGKPVTLADFIPDDGPLLEDAVADADEFARVIGPALDALTPKQRDVLLRRFGLPPYEWPHTMREVAEAWRTTPQYVNNIEQSALRRMRALLGLGSEEDAQAA